jgi:hypothetical protein
MPLYLTAPTVWRERWWASSAAVHRPVDSLCRHAAPAVRSMGTALWIFEFCTQQKRACLGLCRPRVVRRKKFWHVRPCTMAGSYPHWEFHVRRYMCNSRPLVSRLAERSRRRLHEPGGERGWALGGPGCAVRPSGEALGARPAGAAGRRPAGPAEPCGRQTQRPSGMRAFAGRALAGLSSIRACVRQTGDSSAGSAGLSTSLLPARPAQMMRPQGRRPLRTRTARLRGEPRAGRDRTTLTSPGWPRSGEWSLTPIPNSRNVCPVTYPQPNNRL